jgi:hypothetical protein
MAGGRVSTDKRFEKVQKQTGKLLKFTKQFFCLSIPIFALWEGLCFWGRQLRNPMMVMSAAFPPCIPPLHRIHFGPTPPRIAQGANSSFQPPPPRSNFAPHSANAHAARFFRRSISTREA